MGSGSKLLGQSVEDHLAAGREFTTKNPPAALAEFEAVLAVDSTNYEANWGAAQALVDIGKQTPDSVKSRERDSLYARAETLARAAVKADSTGADGHFILAAAIGRASLTKSKKERIKRAAEIRSEALKALALDPNHDRAYHVLGRWNAEIMRLSGLTRFFAKNFLGGAVFNAASWQGAIDNMQKAVALNPESVYHRLDLAEIYVDVDRYSDARQQLTEIAGAAGLRCRRPRVSSRGGGTAETDRQQEGQGLAVSAAQPVLHVSQPVLHVAQNLVRPRRGGLELLPELLAAPSHRVACRVPFRDPRRGGLLLDRLGPFPHQPPGFLPAGGGKEQGHDRTHGRPEH